MSFALRVMQNCKSGGIERFVVFLVASEVDEFYPEQDVSSSPVAWAKVLNVPKQTAEEAIASAIAAGDLVRTEAGVYLNPELIFAAYQQRVQSAADVLEARNVA